MQQEPENVESVVMCCCVLHNLLRMRTPARAREATMIDREDPESHQVIPGEWRDHATMRALDALKGNNSTNKAKAQREYLKQYYNSDVGRVPWQDRMI